MSNAFYGGYLPKDVPVEYILCNNCKGVNGAGVKVIEGIYELWKRLFPEDTYTHPETNPYKVRELLKKQLAIEIEYARVRDITRAELDKD